MNMSYFIWFAVALFLSFLVVAKLGPHIHKFKWSRYALIVGPPVLLVLVFAYITDTKLLIVYVGSAFSGTCAEYTFGRAWHMTMGHRLWEYWRYAPGGYTSLLITPLWGVVGVFFFLLGSVLVT